MMKNAATNMYRTLKNSLLFKIIISYMLIGVILLSLFASIIFNRFSKESINEISGISQNMVFQTYNTANTLMMSDFKYFYQMYNKDPKVFNALYSSRFTSLEMRDINVLLSDAVFSHPLVHSIYIYNAKTRAFFSNVTPVCKAEEFYDKDIIKYMKDPSLFKNQLFALRKTDYSTIGKEKNENLISVIWGEPGNEENGSAFIVNFNQEVLQSILTKGTGKEKSLMMVIDKNGRVVSHLDESTFGGSLDEKPFINKILSSKDSNGFFIDDIDGEKYLVTYVKSSQIGWIFVSTGKYKDLLNSIAMLRRNILILTLVFILFGIFIALIFGRSIYKPVYNLMRKVKQKNKSVREDWKYVDEYGFLNNAFDDMIGDISEMKNNMRSYMNNAKNNILNIILNGDFISLKDMKANIEACKINIDSPYFTVCVFKIDSFDKLKLDNTKEDIALLRFAVSNIADEILNSKFNAEVMDGDYDYIIAIIGTNEHIASNIQVLKELLAKVQQAAQQYLKFTVTVSVGDEAEGVKEIQYSYRQALEYAKYRLILGKSSIIISSYLKEKHENKVYKYPFELEKQIMDVFKLSKKDRLGKLIDDFVKEIEGYRYEEVILSLTQLAIMSVRTAGSMINLEKEGLDASGGSFNKKIYEFETVEDVKEWLFQFYLSVIDILSGKKEGRNEQVVNRINKYIEDNFQNCDLSVESISDFVQLSPNYVRNIFKEVTQKSLSSYIMEVRFQKAMELLDKTDIPANRIAELIGFADGRYFYVAFKKYVGKSPDQYRKRI